MSEAQFVLLPYKYSGMILNVIHTAQMTMKCEFLQSDNVKTSYIFFICLILYKNQYTDNYEQ